MSDESVGRYSVVVRSFRNGVRSDSRLLRLYTVISALTAVFVALLLVLAIPQWVKWTLGQGELNTFSRAMLPWIGLLLLGPMLAPPFYAARRVRDERSSPQTDFLLAVAGFFFLLSLYVALLISAPAAYRDPAPATPLLGATIQFLYDLPPLAGLVPPVLGALGILGVERGS
ncbi:hypothetical protein [Haloarchaeobius sp. DFWS5]|uniref:hypothetical protein n=1 Tax=Haloarchaeobius sp. DFWS5 TaxID=3446114 RepID=UPI003EBF070E